MRSRFSSQQQHLSDLLRVAQDGRLEAEARLEAAERRVQFAEARSARLDSDVRDLKVRLWQQRLPGWSCGAVHVAASCILHVCGTGSSRAPFPLCPGPGLSCSVALRLQQAEAKRAGQEAKRFEREAQSAEARATQAEVALQRARGELGCSRPGTLGLLLQWHRRLPCYGSTEVAC